MASFVDRDNRGLFSINDLTLEEVDALWCAIDTAALPERRELHRLKNQLTDALVPF